MTWLAERRLSERVSNAFDLLVSQERSIDATAGPKTPVMAYREQRRAGWYDNGLERR